MTKGNETRDRILETAFRLAARDGLEGLSIGKLAEELSLSKSGMFAHFGSKEDLYTAVLQHVRRRLAEELALAAGPRGENAAVRALLSAAASEPAAAARADRRAASSDAE